MLLRTAVVMILFCVTACMVTGKTVKGSGEVVKEDRNEGEFTSIVLSGMGTLVLKSGKSDVVQIETDKNLFKYITTQVEKGVLTIEIREDVILKPSGEIIYYVDPRHLSSIEVSGAGTVKTIEQLSLEDLVLVLSGAGKINLDLQVKQLGVKLSGSGDINLRGKGESQEVIVSGAGTYRGLDFITEKTEILLTGVGNAEVYATKNLDAEIAGVGSILYKGSPELHQIISGVGVVRSVEEK